jgi:hypothetical protein
MRSLSHGKEKEAGRSVRFPPIADIRERPHDARLTKFPGGEQDDAPVQEVCADPIDLSGSIGIAGAGCA